MLGKLAKYLRFLGYDTFYPSGRMSDNEILEIARREGRIIITRDKQLAKRSNGLLIKSERYEEQLKEVVKKFNLNSEGLLSRCSVCDEPLVPVSKEKIKEKVPKYIYEHNDKFYLCPKCGRVYWYGSHTEKIEKTIRKILGELNEN